MNLNIASESACKADFFPLGTAGSLELAAFPKSTGVGACVCRAGFVMGPDQRCVPSNDPIDTAFPNTYKYGASCGSDHASTDLGKATFTNSRVRGALQKAGFTKFCRPKSCPPGYTQHSSGQCAQTLPDGSVRLVQSGFMLNSSVWWFGVGNLLLLCACCMCLCSVSSFAATS